MWNRAKMAWLVFRGKAFAMPYCTQQQYRVWYNENEEQLEMVYINRADTYNVPGDEK